MTADGIADLGRSPEPEPAGGVAALFVLDGAELVGDGVERVADLVGQAHDLLAGLVDVLLRVGVAPLDRGDPVDRAAGVLDQRADALEVDVVRRRPASSRRTTHRAHM